MIEKDTTFMGQLDEWLKTPDQEPCIATIDDLSDMSPEDRALLISQTLTEMNRPKTVGDFMVDTNVVMRSKAIILMEYIGKSFSFSDNMREWVDNRRKAFQRTLGQKRHRHIVDTLTQNVSKSQAHIKKALINLSRLQQAIYAPDSVPRLKTAYDFVSYPPDGFPPPAGSFDSDLEQEKGTIGHNADQLHLRGPDIANSIETTCHETTHALQFALAVAFKRGTIRQAHPLYAEARIFHAMKKQKATIPSRLGTAYHAQLAERMAYPEGRALRDMVYPPLPEPACAFPASKKQPPSIELV